MSAGCWLKSEGYSGLSTIVDGGGGAWAALPGLSRELTQGTPGESAADVRWSRSGSAWKCDAPSCRVRRNKLSRAPADVAPELARLLNAQRKRITTPPDAGRLVDPECVGRRQGQTCGFRADGPQVKCQRPAGHSRQVVGETPDTEGAGSGSVNNVQANMTRIAGRIEALRRLLKRESQRLVLTSFMVLPRDGSEGHSERITIVDGGWCRGCLPSRDPRTRQRSERSAVLGGQAAPAPPPHTLNESKPPR